MGDLLNKISNLNIAEVISVCTIIIGFISMLNEKVRDFVLTKLNFKNSKAKLKNETIVNDDNSLDVMLKRINALNNDYIMLSDKYIEAIKDANKYKFLSEQTQQKIKELELKCINNCLKNV